MKKTALIVIAFIFALTGCARMETSKEQAETPTDTTTDPIKISFAQDDNDFFELSAEHSEIIRQFLCNDGWVPDATNCDNNYIVTFDGRTIFYHSECGTFNERLEKSIRSFHLSETDRQTVNDIIQTVLIPTETTLSDELNKLEYQPYTCDGLPEYLLTATDGTVYYINFSEKWVWRENNEQAELPDELISQLKESGMLIAEERPLEIP